MTSQQKWGERCQALECDRARYLPSLIALLGMVFSDHTSSIIYLFSSSTSGARQGLNVTLPLYIIFSFSLYTMYFHKLACGINYPFVYRNTTRGTIFTIFTPYI